MTFIVDGTAGATFPDSSTQAKAGLVAGGTIATGTITTATVSTLNAPSGVLATQNGMTGIAKAWVTFTGSSGAINGSFNVSSVTRNSTGNFTINFTTAMANANYSVSGSAGGGAGSGGILFGSFSAVPTTSAVNVATYTLAVSVADFAYTSVAVFGS